MEYVPDNDDLFCEYEAEQEREKRLRKKRRQAYEEMEYELPFVTVPNDYGTHKELY